MDARFQDLCTQAWRGHLEQVRDLLDPPPPAALLNSTTARENPLYLAVEGSAAERAHTAIFDRASGEFQHRACVQAILDAGADPNVVIHLAHTTMRVCALRQAVYGDWQLVSVLLAAGARPSTLLLAAAEELNEEHHYQDHCSGAAMERGETMPRKSELIASLRASMPSRLAWQRLRRLTPLVGRMRHVFMEWYADVSDYTPEGRGARRARASFEGAVSA